MGTTKTKSKIFKMAWKLKKDAFKAWSNGKGQKMSFSDCLKIAWSMVKKWIVGGRIEQRISIAFDRVCNLNALPQIITTLFTMRMTTL